MSLETKAVLATFSSSLWEARKMDKRESQKTCERLQAHPNAYRSWKTLGDRTLIDKMRKVIAAAREYHNTVTSTWGKSTGILPASILEEYVTKMNGFVSTFSPLVREFLASYSQWIAEAPAILGDGFCQNDYPPLDVVSRKFGISWEFSPVPANDWRCSLSDGERAMLETAFQDRLRSASQSVLDDLWARIRDSLSRVRDTCTEGKKVYETLFSGLEGVVRYGPALNMAGDADIAWAIGECSKIIGKYNPEKIRTNPGHKDNLGVETDFLLEEIGKRTGVQSVPMAQPEPVPAPAPMAQPEPVPAPVVEPEPAPDDFLSDLGL